MLKFFKIEGFSMYPLLTEGTVVLCFKLFSFNKIRKNDFVLFNHKIHGFMIKKVTDITKNGYFVQGENSFSIDSRNFGELKKEDLLYKVIYKFF